MVKLTVAVVAALGVAGCSRDRARDQEPLDHNPGRAEPAPGVGVISANELGPGRGRSIPVSSRSPEALKHFERGRELHDNIRQDEAAESFEKAIALDPEFALAYAYLAWQSKDKTKRDEYAARALDLSAKLPEAERLLVEGIVAQARGERDKLERAYKRLIEAAPNDWRAYNQAAMMAQNAGDRATAFEMFKRAIEVEPNAAQPYNNLAYYYAFERNYVEAVKAARRYAELAPSEPNPHDSLGEISMMAGKFPEAEKSFVRALEVSPRFAIAWQGIAAARMYQGNWAGALEAIERGKALVSEPKAIVEHYRWIAWAHAGAGDKAAALAAIDRMQREAIELGLAEYAVLGPVAASELMLELGDLHGARKHAALALDRAEGKLADTRRPALLQKLSVDVASGKTKQADKLLAELEKLVAGNVRAEPIAKLARAVAAIGRGDHDTAIALLAEIDMMKEGYYLVAQRWILFIAEQTGNADLASKVRDELRAGYTRSPYHAFLVSRLDR